MFLRFKKNGRFFFKLFGLLSISELYLRFHQYFHWWLAEAICSKNYLTIMYVEIIFEFWMEKQDGFGILQEFHCPLLLCLKYFEQKRWRIVPMPLFNFCCIFSSLIFLIFQVRILSWSKQHQNYWTLSDGIHSQQLASTIQTGISWKIVSIFRNYFTPFVLAAGVALISTLLCIDPTNTKTQPPPWFLNRCKIKTDSRIGTS